MRLGGPIFETCETPGRWVAAVQAVGYRTALCPVEPDAPEDVIQAYVSAARDNDIVIAKAESIAL